MGDPLGGETKVLAETAIVPPPADRTAVLDPESGAAWRVPLRGNYEAIATYGEQGMGFVRFPAADGWVLLDGPSGAAGHAYNAPGLDGAGARRLPDGRVELAIADNKAGSSTSVVRSATAITDNLRANLEQLEAHIRQPSFDGLKDIGAFRAAVARARTNIAQGLPLPSDVTLEVTNWGGASTGVSKSLAEQGIRFRNLNELPPTTESKATPNPLRAARLFQPAGQPPPASLLADAVAQFVGPVVERAAEWSLSKRVQNEIDQIEQQSTAYRDAHPDEGVLVVVQTEMRVQGPAEVPAVPNFVSAYALEGGRTLEEARARKERAARITTGKSSAEHQMRADEYHWIPSRTQEAALELLRARAREDESSSTEEP